VPVFAVRGGLTTAQGPPSPTVGGGLPVVVSSRSRERHRSDDPDHTRTGTGTGRGAQRRQGTRGAANAHFVFATPHFFTSERAAIRCKQQNGTQTGDLNCPPRPFLTCPRPLPGTVAPLATACATLALMRSDGAARLATLERFSPSLTFRAVRGSRHDSRITGRSAHATGEATRTAAVEEEAGSSTTRPGSRNRNSRKTRETAGKNFNSRLYYGDRWQDLEVL